MGTVKRNSILKNILHLFYSTVFASGLNAITLIVLASYLKSYHYGLFSVVLAFAMIMGYFTDAGLSRIVVREGSANRANIPVVITSYLKLRLLLLVGTLIIGFGILHLFYSDNSELVRAAYYLLIPMVSGLTLQSIGTAYFQVIEKMHLTGLIRITSSILLVSVVLLGMLFSLNPVFIYTLYGCSYFVAGLFGLYLIRKNMTFVFRSTFHKGLLKEIWPFTIAGFLFVMTPQLGPILLEQTVSLAEVGLFAVAYRIPQALQQVPFVIAGAYYPVMYRQFHEGDIASHTRLNVMQIKMMSIMGMMMAFPLFFLSDNIIAFLFGPSWLAASEPLKVLAIMLALQSMNIALADGLTTQEMQYKRTIVQGVALLCGCVLYIVLSRGYGILGAAYAGLLLETISLVGYMSCTPKRVTLLKKAIVPYASLFLVTLFIITTLLSAMPIVGTLIGYFVLIGLVLLDKDLSRRIMEQVRGKQVMKQQAAKEVKHG